MLRAIAAFEWRMHTRQVAFIAAAILFFGFGMVMAATGFGPANVDVNSPWSIAESLSLLSIFSVFVIAVFCSNAIVRDRDQRMEEIVFTTAVGKLDFLGGRFAGSFLAALTIMAFSVPGMMAGVLLRGTADGRTAPFRIAAYLWPLLVLVAPSMLLAAAVIFAVAAFTRSALASHVAAVMIYVAYFVASALTNSPLMASSTAAGTTSGSIGALLDPFGLSAFFEMTRYWTPAMRNARLLPLDGTLLVNRALAIGLAAVILGVVYRQFRFRVLSAGRAGGKEDAERQETDAVYRSAKTRVSQVATFAAQLRSELHSLFTSIPFLLVVLLWMALAATEIAGDLSAEHGSVLQATTSIVLGGLGQPLQLIALITLIYFGTEIVWRERSSRMDGIVNATPAAGWSFVLAKWLTLAGVVGTLTIAGFAVALAMQLMRDAKPGAVQYLGFAWFRGLPLVLFSALTVFVHAVSRRKYAGMLVVIVAAVLFAAGGVLGVPHHLWRFASAPAQEWSDMNGFAPSLLPFHAYMLHWSVVAALMLVVGAAMWREAPVRSALRKSALSGRITAATLAVTGVMTALLIAYCTTVLNVHETPAERAAWKADYEKQYRQYAARPRPRIERIEAVVNLYPREARATIRGHYVLANRSAHRIESILVAVRRDANIASLTIPGGRLAWGDTRFGQYWFALARPLAPGERVQLAFDVTLARRGFDDDEPDYSIVANGSYLPHLRAFPTLGYRASYELSDPAERRRHALPPRREQPPVHGEDVADDWVTFDITLSTEAAQTAVTSGKLVSASHTAGRSTFRYRSDEPVPNAIDFTSARYAVAKAQSRGIPVEIYYEPRHAANVRQMLDSALRSLALYQRAFGPYRFTELRLAELPSYWPFGGFASPGMVVLPENRSFMTEPAPPGKLDLIVRRVAHEVAHQWWGHSVSPANAPGGAAIVETLTKYAEILALEAISGSDAVRQNAEFELDRYLRGRADQHGTEPPLSLVRNEPHIFYGKGTVVMGAVRDLLGEERLNRALASLLAARSGPGQAAATQDLLSAIGSVATPEERDLIASWFERVVLYDLEITAADVRRRRDGKYAVIARIRAARSEHRPDGRIAALPIHEPITIALRNAAGELQRVRTTVKGGENEVVMIATARPTSLVLDPDVTRVDENRGDNVRDLR